MPHKNDENDQNQIKKYWNVIHDDISCFLRLLTKELLNLF